MLLRNGVYGAPEYLCTLHWCVSIQPVPIFPNSMKKIGEITRKWLIMWRCRGLGLMWLAGIADIQSSVPTCCQCAEIKLDTWKKKGNWFEYPSPCIFICGACYVAKLQWVYCDIYIRSSIRTWPWRGRIQLVNQGTGLRSVEQSLAIHVSWNLFMANETCSYVQLCRIQTRKAHILVQYLRHAEQDACSLHVSFSSSVSL